MRIHNISIQRNQRHCRLQADVDSTTYRTPFSLWIEGPHWLEEVFAEERCDPFLPAVMLPAMCLGESVHLEESVSPQLLENIGELQAIYHCWHPKLSIVDVTAAKVAAPSANAQQNGVFFSGGVDSFYSLVKRALADEAATKRISTLILVQGFDIPLSERGNQFFSRVVANAEQAARSFSVSLLPVRTNFRRQLDRHVPWGLLGHGPALAAIGLSMQSLFSTICIASTVTYRDLLRGARIPYSIRFGRLNR
jgi:hypothetical protein